MLEFVLFNDLILYRLFQARCPLPLTCEHQMLEILISLSLVIMLMLLLISYKIGSLGWSNLHLSMLKEGIMARTLPMS